MKRTHHHHATLAALLLMTTSTIWAQTIFRSVDANGRITYSDKPPVAAAKSERSAATGAGDDDANTALPYLLRQAASAFPVTLYTGPSCGEPCNSGRALLAKRGVPFSEKTISTQADIDALQGMAGDAMLPFLTIGGQHLRGFSDAEWNQYLNAAGYPASSQLPSNFRNAAPAALGPKPAQPVEPAPVAPPAPPTRSPSNPAGIQF
jgi:glutaredoxin